MHVQIEHGCLIKDRYSLIGATAHTDSFFLIILLDTHESIWLAKKATNSKPTATPIARDIMQNIHAAPLLEPVFLEVRRYDRDWKGNDYFPPNAEHRREGLAKGRPWRDITIPYCCHGN